ncbi:MAG: hypothetical protein HY685_03830 [Chloroflexi bacterium]|nr:hypothetical protein [Chloroflexota bacterium]
MNRNERGYILIMVLILMAVGTLAVIPTLNIVTSGFKSKQVQSQFLAAQYTSDAGAEFALWQLLYGGATSLLTGDGAQSSWTVSLNGVVAQVIIRETGATVDRTLQVPGARDNRVRPSKTVVCDKDGDGFDDECEDLPTNGGMKARYTVYLEQVSPDTSVGIVAVYDELPKGFALVPGSVTSPDGSLPGISTVTPVNIGSPSNQVWKWDLAASPVYFQRGEVKKFTFDATINKSKDRYCNGVFLKLQAPPNEKSGKTAHVLVGTTPPEACDSGGGEVVKYVDKSRTPPNTTTILTYVVNVNSVDQNTLHIDRLKDVLPQGSFQYCSPTYPPPTQGPSCDPPMYRIANTPFDPEPENFSDVTGFTVWNDPLQTYLTAKDRWELIWDGPGGAGWDIAAAGQAGDVFILRFQVQAAPVKSGTYYNEVFADVDCAAPQPLITEGVTTAQEYCASYSWPTGGVAVPSYDVRSVVGGITAQGSVSLDMATNTAQLISWQVN